MGLFDNKVVLIIGVFCGIGKVIVEECVKQGVKVVFIYLFFEEKVCVLEMELIVNGGVVKGFCLDVVKFDEV